MSLRWPTPNVNEHVRYSRSFGAIRRRSTGLVIHNGIDIGRYKQNVRAAEAGVVTFAGWARTKGGLMIFIKHAAGGLETRYMHLLPGSLKVKAGQKVKKGQIIAQVGYSGASSEYPHLHFELLYAGKRMDPEKIRRGPWVLLGLVALAPWAWLRLK